MRSFIRPLLWIVAVAAIVLTIDALVLRTHAQPEPTEHAAPRKAEGDANSLHASSGQRIGIASLRVESDFIRECSKNPPSHERARRRVNDRRALVFDRELDNPIEVHVPSIRAEFASESSALLKLAGLPPFDAHRVSAIPPATRDDWLMWKTRDWLAGHRGWTLRDEL